MYSKRESTRAGNGPARVTSGRIPALRLAFFGILLFIAFISLPLVRSNVRLTASFLGAGCALFALLLWVRYRSARAGRHLRYETLPRPVHYVQMAMHASIYAYWGWYWREVYHYIPLILAQVVFVYVLDMLICWSRRDKWILGFGPFPIVFSTNLFLWFRDDWFFLQFLLVATGVLCKEFITWNREGRRTHIFNPSAIALCLFSIGLLVTHSSHISWGEEVAVTLGRPPYIYAEIFLIGLVVQALFSVTLVTLAAAGTLYTLNLAWTHSTGVYYFIDSNIPAAVFLGLHLLVTDPATSPRTNAGKVFFGALYGCAVFAMYSILGAWGAPTFYDKLLCVPPLNLAVQLIDRAAVWFMSRLRRLRFRPLEALQRWPARKLNFVHMGIWISLFCLMFTTGFVGNHHPGAVSEFWQQACVDGKRNACRTWTRTLDTRCLHGSGRACVTLGLLVETGTIVPGNAADAGRNFARACDLGVAAACRHLVEFVAHRGESAMKEDCDRGDGENCFIMASLYYSGSGVPKDSARAVELFRQSCSDGWSRGCGGLAECFRSGAGTPRDEDQAIRFFEKACQAGIAPSCFAVAEMYRSMNKETLARQRVEEGCTQRDRFAMTNAAWFVPAAVSDSTAAVTKPCRSR